MYITYKNTDFSIGEMLELAKSCEAVIPSIQRPFVWEPDKVTKFIDSLFRGWPFGTMLFLNKEENEHSLFPFRLLEKIVNPAKETKDYQGDGNYQYLVLDGQQRLQSLLIAFMGGYTFTRKSSGKEIKEQIKYLCFRLSAYKSLTDMSFDVEADTEDEDALVWKTAEEIKEENGDLIKLADVFQDAEIALPSDNESYQWLRHRITAIKKLNVPVLIIYAAGMSSTSESTEEQVVEIFTRLNTQGTPLSREQILAAKIKQVWDCFPQKVESLLSSLYQPPYNMSGYLNDDDLISGFNLLLEVHTNARDITAAYTQLKNDDWNELWSQFEKITKNLIEKLTENRYVRYRQEYQSMHAIWFIVTLLHETEESENLSEELLDEIVRWLMVTGWAKIWANKSSQSVKTYKQKLKQLKTQQEAMTELRAWLADEELQKSATMFIDNMLASARGSVRIYYTALWVWMRMDNERAKLLTAFKSDHASWQVDHIIPAAWFKNDADHYHTINRLGNCWLLNSEANNAKSDTSFSEFLDMYNFKHDANVVKIIKGEGLVEYEKGQPIGNVGSIIVEREKQIQQAIEKYIKGEDDSVQLSYINGGEQRVYTPRADDIYRGNEYIVSPAFLCHKSKGAKSSYLSHIRSAFKMLGWNKDFGPCQKESPSEIKTFIRQNHMEIIRDTRIDSKDRSAWKEYIDFLIGETSPIKSKICLLPSQKNNKEEHTHKIPTLVTNRAMMFSKERMNQFESWLIETDSKSESTSYQYSRLLKNADMLKYCSKHGINELYSITFDAKIRELIEKLEEDDDFISFSKKKNNAPMAAIKAYERFCNPEN